MRELNSLCSSLSFISSRILRNKIYRHLVHALNASDCTCIIAALLVEYVLVGTISAIIGFVELELLEVLFSDEVLQVKITSSELNWRLFFRGIRDMQTTKMQGKTDHRVLLSWSQGPSSVTEHMALARPMVATKEGCHGAC